MSTHQRLPAFIIELKRQGIVLAKILNVPFASTTGVDGLYVAHRHRRDPRKLQKYITVRLRRDGIEVFRSEESYKDFPSDHLITQLMLVR